MRVVVLGGAGFLGKKLVHKLLTVGEFVDTKGEKQVISKLVVFDKFKADLPESLLKDERLELLAGDITDKTTLQAVLLPRSDLIFHLAAVVSGEAEQDFNLGRCVNLIATQNLLELCRHMQTTPKVLFASSVAVFGGDMPGIIQDDTAPTPQSSYGTQKAIGELLMNDYSRKGFIDARVLRFPTIVVRPGKPNAATSTFASSIIREPLQNQKALCPVSPDTKLWIQSPRQAITSLIQATNMNTQALGAHRTLSLPGISVSVEDMVKALENVAGTDATKLIEWKHDPFIQSIVGSWPNHFTAARARQLGFKADSSMQTIIQAFIEDDLN